MTAIMFSTSKPTPPPQYQPRQLRPGLRRLALVVRGAYRLVRALTARLTSASFIFVVSAPFLLWSGLLLCLERDSPDQATLDLAVGALHGVLRLWLVLAAAWAVTAFGAGARKHALSVFLGVAALLGVMFIVPSSDARPTADYAASSASQ